VAIIGSSSNVGKTALTRALSREMLGKKISVACESEINTMSRMPYFIQDGDDTVGHVLLLGAEYSPLNDKRERDKIIKKKGDELGLPITQMDLRIYIYRPDRPFRNDELKFSDIIIKNDHATNKEL